MRTGHNSELMADFKVFASHRREWLQKHAGQFVVVHKGAVAGFYDDYATGLHAGIKTFGVKSKFLVQQVYEGSVSAT